MGVELSSRREGPVHLCEGKARKREKEREGGMERKGRERETHVGVGTILSVALHASPSDSFNKLVTSRTIRAFARKNNDSLAEKFVDTRKARDTCL